jgi:hypothetical protein
MSLALDLRSRLPLILIPSSILLVIGLDFLAPPFGFDEPGERNPVNRPIKRQGRFTL